MLAIVAKLRPGAQGDMDAFEASGLELAQIVGQLIKDSDQSLAAHEYSPFGKTTVKTGTYADENKFGFSSEYFDKETNLVYFAFRYYSPELGRWLSRDPIGEQGGFNLYAMLANNPVNGWDGPRKPSLSK
jgi:RHS repeat-associated protein